MNRPSLVSPDLLAWRPVRALVDSAAFPLALQVITMAVMSWLAISGAGIGAGMKADELMTLRKTNITTLVVWGLWWPGMIAVALALGRAWCTVCPMELVNRLGDSLARRAAWPRARLGRFLRAGWMTVAVYLVMQLLVAGGSVHRVPHYTSVLLATLAGGALLSGFLFREHRSFCKAFCPASALLSVYGRHTPIQLEVRDQAVCDACPSHDCLRARNRERFDKRSCPSLLVPFRRDPSDGCVLCLQCAKVCPYHNMGLGLVESSAPVRRKGLLRPFEAAFVMIALGFVAHEVIGEVNWLDGTFHSLPAWLNTLVPSIPFGWYEALWFLVVFPLLVWAVVCGIGYLIGHRGDLRTLLLAAATGAAPVVAVAHLAKAAAKITAWGGFLPLALHDPLGVDTLRRIADHTLASPAGFLGLSALGWAMLATTLAVFGKAYVWSRQVPAGSVAGARAGLACAAVLFSAVLTAWVWPV
ncbi:MAG: hypothetical protein AB1714_11830 [Acidobacteriota bacterium]